MPPIPGGILSGKINFGENTALENLSQSLNMGVKILSPKGLEG